MDDRPKNVLPPSTVEYVTPWFDAEVDSPLAERPGMYQVYNDDVDAMFFARWSGTQWEIAPQMFNRGATTVDAWRGLDAPPRSGDVYDLSGSGAVGESTQSLSVEIVEYVVA